MAERVIATRPENPRAASPEEIQQAGSRSGTAIEMIAEVDRAIERARVVAGTRAIVVITGSIYLVGAAMDVLNT
jgi:folylpolyglutamate synthase/dihydropteroate synthase